MSMSLSRRAIGTTAMLVMTATWASTGVAEADAGSEPDAVGDVWKAGDGGEMVPAPHHAIGDIKRVKVNHTDRAVLVRISFRELKRRGQALGVGGYLRTRGPATQEYPMGFFWEAGPPDSEAGGWQGWGELDTGGTGYSGHIDYAANVISLRVLRTELGNPRWVRVMLHSSHDVGDLYTSDLAFTSQPDEQVWTPRIYRRGTAHQA